MDYVLKIKELLKEKRLSLGEFAQLIGKNRNTVTNYLSGKTKIDIETFVKIAQVLGVPVGYFFGESGAQPERAGSMSDCEKELEMLKALIQEKTERIKLLEQMIAMLQEQCRGRGG